jgi:hypothetical protein
VANPQVGEAFCSFDTSLCTPDQSEYKFNFAQVNIKAISDSITEFVFLFCHSGFPKAALQQGNPASIAVRQIDSSR